MGSDPVRIRESEAGRSVGTQATAAGGGGRQRRRWPVLVPAIAIAVGLSLATPAGRHQWALSIFRQPTRYTALWFNHAWALPSNGTRNKALPVSFAISNQQGRTVTYTYVIKQTDPLNDTKALGTATRTVTAGHIWEVRAVIRLSCDLSPCRVEVVLPGHRETIDFLIVLSGHP